VYNTQTGNFGFNIATDAINDFVDITGGFCRVGGSPSTYKKAGDVPCSEEDMITTLEDCEAAFNELALEGYYFYGEYDGLEVIPGCYWGS
jgi:hypothetical protein